MCNFYSCIIDQKGKVYDDPAVTDSHEDLINKYKLNDKGGITTAELKKRPFVRIEVTPDFNKLSKRFKKSDWSYKVDEPGTVPIWYQKNEKKMEGIVWKRLQEIYKTLFLFGGKYEELPFDLMILVKDSRVKEMKNQKVRWMFGSSQVGKMWGSSQVGKMWGSSQVGKMWGSSQVGKMWDSSQVGEMWDSSQVGEMWDSSQVGEMLDSSQVGKMWGSSQVGKMWGSSQVGEMWDSSTATKWNSNAKANQQGSNTVVIDRSGNKVTVKIGK